MHVEMLMLILISCCIHNEVNSIQCYQCDSRYDEYCSSNDGNFDVIQASSQLIDCIELDITVTNQICVKVSQSIPDSIYYKGIITVIRRCATIQDRSVSFGCRYYVNDVGLYVETCYCSDNDGCNSTNIMPSSFKMILAVLLFTFLLNNQFL